MTQDEAFECAERDLKKTLRAATYNLPPPNELSMHAAQYANICQRTIERGDDMDWAGELFIRKYVELAT